jgi:hypothetical protein
MVKMGKMRLPPYYTILSLFRLLCISGRKIVNFVEDQCPFNNYYCLFFLDIRILIAPLVSSNSS